MRLLCVVIVGSCLLAPIRLALAHLSVRVSEVSPQAKHPNNSSMQIAESAVLIVARRGPQSRNKPPYIEPKTTTPIPKPDESDVGLVDDDDDSAEAAPVQLPFDKANRLTPDSPGPPDNARRPDRPEGPPEIERPDQGPPERPDVGRPDDLPEPPGRGRGRGH